MRTRDTISDMVNLVARSRKELMEDRIPSFFRYFDSVATGTQELQQEVVGYMKVAQNLGVKDASQVYYKYVSELGKLKTRLADIKEDLNDQIFTQMDLGYQAEIQRMEWMGHRDTRPSAWPEDYAGGMPGDFYESPRYIEGEQGSRYAFKDMKSNVSNILIRPQTIKNYWTENFPRLKKSDLADQSTDINPDAGVGKPSGRTKFKSI